jgi:dynein heavy chain, axonemal
MEKQQRITETELAEIQSALAALSKQLGELNVSFEAANKELDALQSEASLMSKRLAAASKLIDGLTGERVRWGVDVGNLEIQKVKLVGDCLLGSSFQSYLGAFTAAFRKELTYDKFLTDVTERNIPVSEPFR